MRRKSRPWGERRWATRKIPFWRRNASNGLSGTILPRKTSISAFASAEETAKSREGDCTEHAVLCAALGRVVGLPTRCVVGFGYIPPGVDQPTIAKEVAPDTGIFGFHMWAEAWIGPDKWVPMDAALDGFDVGHIAITKSALEEVNPIVDLNTPIFQLMKSLKIEIVKTVRKDDMPKPCPACRTADASRREDFTGLTATDSFTASSNAKFLKAHILTIHPSCRGWISGAMRGLNGNARDHLLSKETWI